MAWKLIFPVRPGGHIALVVEMRLSLVSSAMWETSVKCYLHQIIRERRRGEGDFQDIAHEYYLAQKYGNTYCKVNLVTVKLY